MKKNKKVYISGPISGLPKSTVAQTFERAERDLRDEGYQNIINPCSMFAGTGLSYDDIMAHCLELVRSSDLLVLLPGWQKSRGVAMELGVAYALKIPVREYRPRRSINYSIAIF